MDFLDIIWIVVCIVLVAVPDLVFNNKKKKSARGRTRTSGPMPPMPENFPMPSVPSEPESMLESMPTEDEPEDFPVWTEPEEMEEPAVPQVQAVEQPKPVVEQFKPVVEQPKPVAVKEVARRPASPALQTDSSPADDGKKEGKLCVDPRNLVIYTAIMEPKFKEM